MINPNFNISNNNINNNNNNNNDNNNNDNDNYKFKIEFLLNQKQLNINSNSQEKISNVKEKKNKLTKSYPIKKTKDQKKIIEPLKNNKIQIEHLQSNVRCKKCNELPSFKHDNKRWYCKYCEKPFTPISFKNLTTENFQK
ncbi:hypothetical protein ACTFIZ_009869 [Dictyostelium cf. discoideum]